MKPRAITVGIPVRELDAAIRWYQAAFDLGEPDQRPMDDLAEFDLGAFWLQLAQAPELAGHEGISINLSIENASAQRETFAANGLEVGPLHHFEGVVDFFELTDLDGNKIGFVTELS